VCEPVDECCRHTFISKYFYPVADSRLVVIMTLPRSYLAAYQLLIRVAEIRVEEKFEQRYTWPRLRDELDRMHLGFFEGDAGSVWQRTETTTFQRHILTAKPLG